MLFLVFDFEIVEKGFDAVLDSEAGAEQGCLWREAILGATIVEHHQVISKLYRTIGKKNTQNHPI